MDKQTKHELDKITSRIPRRLVDNLTKVVVDTSGEDMAKVAIADKHVHPQTKKRLARLLAKGAFRSEETVIDENVTNQIDDYHRKAIARARRAGRLKDPNDDPYVRARNRKIREHQNND